VLSAYPKFGPGIYDQNLTTIDGSPEMDPESDVVKSGAFADARVLLHTWGVGSVPDEHDARLVSGLAVLVGQTSNTVFDEDLHLFESEKASSYKEAFVYRKNTGTDLEKVLFCGEISKGKSVDVSAFSRADIFELLARRKRGSGDVFTTPLFELSAYQFFSPSGFSFKTVEDENVLVSMFLAYMLGRHGRPGYFKVGGAIEGLVNFAYKSGLKMLQAMISYERKGEDAQQRILDLDFPYQFVAILCADSNSFESFPFHHCNAASFAYYVLADLNGVNKERAVLYSVRGQPDYFNTLPPELHSRFSARILDFNEFMDARGDTEYQPPRHPFEDAIAKGTYGIEPYAPGRHFLFSVFMKRKLSRRALAMFAEVGTTCVRTSSEA